MQRGSHPRGLAIMGSSSRALFFHHHTNITNMKRNIIGAIVAGILIMAWQTASHTFLNLNAAQEQYTPNQLANLEVLSQNLDAKGQYFLPTVPPGSSMDAYEKLAEASMGKPYASIIYNPVMDYNMGMNLFRGLGTNILLGVVLVWLLGKLRVNSMGGIVTACLGISFIAFCFYPYPGFIWYEIPGIWVELFDGLVAFGLAGLWLGWWMTRKGA